MLLFRSLLRILFLLAAMAAPASAQSPVLGQFLGEVSPSELIEGADTFGRMRDDLPVVPVQSGDKTLGWAFVTSDFVGTTGYSGKPIHAMVAIGQDAVLRAVRLVKHSEPIVLIGIPEAKVQALTASYAGLDIAA